MVFFGSGKSYGWFVGVSFETPATGRRDSAGQFFWDFQSAASNADRECIAFFLSVQNGL